VRSRSIINTAKGTLRRPRGAPIAVCVWLAAVAGGVLLVGAGSAVARVDLHATGLVAPEPTIQTQVSVDGQAGGTVPAPPADVMGTPSDSTLVASDQLYMTKINSDGSTYNQWAKIDSSKADNGGISDQGGYGQESARPLLNPNVMTAAGRFLDPLTARVLSLKLTRLGSDGLLTLSSANGTADPEWGMTPATTCPLGGTCSLGLSSPAPGLVTVADSGAVPPGTTMQPSGGPGA